MPESSERDTQVRLGAYVAAVAAIIVIVAMLQPPDRGHMARSKVSRVRSDMRSLATALEAYRVDHGAYPAMVPLRHFIQDTRAIGHLNAGSLSAPDTGSRTHAGLTTPVAYLTGVFLDPFAYYRRGPGLPIAYYTDGHGWILISPGPDGTYDITDPAKVYDSSTTQPSDLLLAGGLWTYDPTNGTLSWGDIWRVKQ